MKKTGNPWSVPVAVDDIPDTGLHMAIEAPAAPAANSPSSRICANCLSFPPYST